MTKYTYDDNIISDLHKDAMGFRPSESFWDFWISATPDEKQKEWDSLCNLLEREIEREKAEQEIAIKRFEDLVEKTIASGARDRETALRWIMDASDCDGDWEYLCYHHGLPYGYFKKAA